MTEIGPNALQVLNQRYFKTGEDWSALIWRVVNGVAKKESHGFKMRVASQLEKRIWLPNSPTLANAGTKTGGLMACFVVGPDEDTMENHFQDTLADIALVAKRGGGCGFSGANIREKGASVAGSSHDMGNGIAYGPNWFSELVSFASAGITQGGLRRMALMYSLPATHADAKAFLELKQNGNEDFNNNMNQSLFAPDAWMKEAVENPKSQQGKLLDRLAYNAWNNGEPGLLFDDTINNNTPYNACGCPRIITTNPCGEQPLPSYGTCNLASINLSHQHFIKDGEFWFGGLADIVHDMTRFLDDVGSMNVFPNGKFEKWYNDHRPIGIGVMGFADLLLNLGIVYGSKESRDLIADIMRTITEVSYQQSHVLGIERGVPKHCKHVDRRNITTVSIAPTGSIATIAECSHGIEPVFADEYNRTDERGALYLYKHPLAGEEHFRCSVSEDYSRMPTYKQHIDIQAAAQIWVDSGVSKTINMVNGVSVKEVKDAMVYAWESGCKGITVYRDGSRQVQVLIAGELHETQEGEISCPTGVCEI